MATEENIAWSSEITSDSDVILSVEKVVASADLIESIFDAVEATLERLCTNAPCSCPPTEPIVDAVWKVLEWNDVV